VSLVSIVTLVKDDAAGLQRTYTSINTQNTRNWEMLIVVAESIDNSIELADDISDNDDAVRVIRQRGLGIFQAMNDGINHADGKFIWFMNSGDIFAGPEVLGLAINQIMEFSVGVVVGGYQIKNNSHLSQYSFREKSITPLSFAFSRRGGCHQAMIFQTSLVKELGGYDLKYKVNSDFDLVLSVIKLGGGKRVSQIYAEVEPGGFADQNIFTVHREKHEARKSLFQSRWITTFSVCWTFAAHIKILSRKLIYYKGSGSTHNK
jgi:putative colanic acid biosynthesis glycosyltransferase